MFLDLFALSVAAAAAAVNCSASMASRSGSRSRRGARAISTKLRRSQKYLLQRFNFSGSIRTATSLIFPGSAGTPALLTKAGFVYLGLRSSVHQPGAIRPVRLESPCSPVTSTRCQIIGGRASMKLSPLTAWPLLSARLGALCVALVVFAGVRGMVHSSRTSGSRLPIAHDEC
jgi:hypothetical protein